jgi:hypothetical protein
MAALGKSAQTAQAFYTTKSDDTLAAWHTPLGHMGVKELIQLRKDGLIEITDERSSKFKSEDCDVCTVTKHTRQPFSDVPVKATKPLEIVHSDLAGPLKPALNGEVYYVTFIYDFTSFVYVAGIKSKTSNEVFGVYKTFEASSELLFGTKIQLLRTDGGGEYKEPLTNYLKTKGTIHHVTTSYMPQLNGVAERWNRTLKNMARSMLIDTKLDMTYWELAVKYSSYIHNSSIMIEGKSLFETYFKQKAQIRWDTCVWDGLLGTNSAGDSSEGRSDEPEGAEGASTRSKCQWLGTSSPARSR